MGEPVELQVDDEVAAQEPIVEDEVEEVVVSIEGEPLLAGLKEEAFAELQEELLQMGDDGRLEIGFGVSGLLVEPEELEDVRFLQDVLGFHDDLALGSEAFHARLVAAEGE